MVEIRRWWLKHIVARRAALPAMEAVLIGGVPGALFLTATDASGVRARQRRGHRDVVPGDAAG